MRVLASISFACALASWSAGTAYAVPTPLLGPQRVIPSATRDPLSVNPGVLYPRADGPKRRS